MKNTPKSILDYIQAIVGAWRDDPRDDAQLLTQFVEAHDEGAFIALLWRHGRLVWRTCARVLGDGPDAEDAFQATFLALSRKASQLRADTLAGWLNRVARQTALNVEIKSRKRQSFEHHLQIETSLASDEHVSRAELYAALDEELECLPEKLRVPLILCYLEEKSQDDVARILGCSRTAVRKRLARGEAMLREQLERRGLAVGVVSVGALLGSTVPAPAVPARLIGSTARAAVAFRSGSLTGGAAEAAQAVLGALPSSLGTTIMRKSSWIVLACCLGMAGGALVACQALSARLDEPGEAGPAATQAPSQPGPGDRAAAHVDCYGDPLPAHALARMGTTRLYYHGGGIFPSTALAFSPDGKTLATHIDAMTVCLWDAATGKEIRRLTTKAVQGNIKSLDFSRDSKMLVAVNYEGKLFRWDVVTGKSLRRQEYQGSEKGIVQSLRAPFLFLPGSKSGVRAFSRDGKLVATVKEVREVDKKIKTSETIISLWDGATGESVFELTHDGGNVGDDVSMLAFAPDGKMLASGDQKTICVWEVATGKKIHLFKKTEAFPCSLLTFSPDGKTLFGGSERASHLWDIGTGKEIRSFVGDEEVKVALFSPDGKILARGDGWGSIRLLEVATGKETGPRKGYRGPIQSVAYSPDGKTLASLGEGETVRLWEVATGKEMRPLAKHNWGNGRWVTGGIAYSPDGKKLVSMDMQAVHLRDTVSGKEIRSFKRGGFNGGWRSPLSATFSPDGKILATMVAPTFPDKDTYTVYLCEVATGKVIHECPFKCVTRYMQPQFCHLSLIFSPDGRLLATPGDENTVSLWEVATGKKIGQLVGPKPTIKEDRYVRFLAFSSDGRMLVTSSAGHNDTVRLWEVGAGKEIWHLDGKNAGAGYQEGCTLAFSPDGKILATASQRQVGIPSGDFDPKVVHLWEVASGKEIGRLTGHQNGVQTIAFSPDGKSLASGSKDLTCLVWDVTVFGSRLKPALAPSPVPRALSKKQLEAAWNDLAEDPAKATKGVSRAYAAVWALQAAPAQAIPLLRARVRPVAPPADPQQLKRWIADLDDNSFVVRDKAQREIEKLGEGALPTLRQALKERPALEARRRLKDLLARLDPKMVGVSPQRLREFRAVQVLEYIGTAEARQVLQALAKGVAEASLTQDAQAALARLAKRSAATP